MLLSPRRFVAINRQLPIAALSDSRCVFLIVNDPRDTTVAFTLAWAKRLRGFHTLADLQRAAGCKGACAPYPDDNEETWEQCRWRSVPPRVDGVGYILATIRTDGAIGVSVSTVEDLTIVLNTNGAFICDRCQPPI